MESCQAPPLLQQLLRVKDIGWRLEQRRGPSDMIFVRRHFEMASWCWVVTVAAGTMIAGGALMGYSGRA